ncbi:MAG: LysR family transcriptional regulator [Lachnospiraceae bacterium]|nr:LysR family transcriptional regulator [Lachnospiraceae bacterium]
MSITKYKAFLKVAELGSLTKAAQALGYSQPNISHMIKTLENDFGFSLFTRSKDNCTITKNGETILYYCSQIVKYEDQLQAEVKGIFGLLTGSVRIGATNSAMIDFVPKVIHRFTTSYSGIELLPREMDADSIIQTLKMGNIDLGFLEENAVPDELHRNFIPLFRDPLCLILPPNHPLVSYSKIPIEKIKGCDFILPIIPGTENDSQFDDILSKMSPNVKYKAASDLAIFGMVENNLGISIMSKEMTKYMHCQVESRDFAEGLYRTLGVLVSSPDHATPAVREFISVAKTIQLQDPEFMNE